MIQIEILKVEELCKRFRKADRTFAAVDHVSFTIQEGECVGLVGVSGCGKSTTANMVARLLKESSGTITFHGRKITGHPGLKMVGKELQMIFQNPLDSFDPRDTVLRGVMQGAASYRLYPKEELKKRSLELLGYVGLKAEYADRKIAELSGGECQRVAIARALVCEPKLLVCDEATSALDVLVQAQIIELLRRMKAERHMAMLFITHDLPLAAVLCDRIAVMDKGRIVETGEPRQVLNAPQQKETKRLIDSIITLDTAKAKV